MTLKMKPEKRFPLGKYILGIALMFLQLSALGRNPAGMSYDLQVLDSGHVVTNQAVSLRFSFASQLGGDIVFVETHATKTDLQGNASAILGEGKPEKGNFDQIDLATGTYFIQVEYDLSGQGNYHLLSNSRLLSVTRVQKWLFGREKFNTVLTIIIVIWLGIIVYLLMTGRRISRLEKDLKKMKQ
ncbi:MAG TPA: CcmD family protein [Bacteroidetes bacterium]|nr:CcmD family protein [Bacteroidota bacterium]